MMKIIIKISIFGAKCLLSFSRSHSPLVILPLKAVAYLFVILGCEF